jgi:hypothetical protein
LLRRAQLTGFFLDFKEPSREGHGTISATAAMVLAGACDNEARPRR